MASSIPPTVSGRPPVEEMHARDQLRRGRLQRSEERRPRHGRRLSARRAKSTWYHRAAPVPSAHRLRARPGRHVPAKRTGIVTSPEQNRHPTLARARETRRRNTSPVAMPRTPPSGLRSAVSACQGQGRDDVRRCSARMPDSPAAPPRRASRNAAATAAGPSLDGLGAKKPRPRPLARCRLVVVGVEVGGRLEPRPPASSASWPGTGPTVSPLHSDLRARARGTFAVTYAPVTGLTMVASTASCARARPWAPRQRSVCWARRALSAMARAAAAPRALAYDSSKADCATAVR